MFLKRLFTSRVKNRFFFFYVDSLTPQNKILTCTRSTFCTAISINTEFSHDVKYYREYLKSKPESYTYFADIFSLEREVISNIESFKLSTNLFKNFEENPSSDELQKTVATEFSCDVNEICKKIILIGKSIDTKNYSSVKLMRKIDNELFKKQLSFDEIFKILIAINVSNLKKINFSKAKICRLLKNCKNLSPHQVVQIFLLMPKKDFSKYEQKYNILLYVNDNISLFNVDEIGIITRGLARGNFTFSHGNIANAIIGKITENIKNIPSVPLISMCKAIFKLGCRFDMKLLQDLQEKSIPYVSNFNIEVLLELSELGIKYGCINSSFWETAVRKYKENLSNLLPFNILRIQKQSIIYNIKDDELLKLIIKEFEKFEYNEKLIQNFLYFLCNLTYYNLYPKNLFDIVLSEEFISNKIQYNTNKKILCKLRLAWWILYASVEAEKPEYLNYTLNDKYRKKLYFLFQFILWNHENFFIRQLRSFTDKIENYLKNLYGENTIVRTDCIPLYHDGLILRFNKYLEAQPIPEEFYLNRKSYVKKPLDDNNYWVFLTLIPCNYYVLNEQTIFAHRPTQHRQLKALGYTPIMVPLKLYSDHVKKSTQDRFITELLQNSVKKEENMRRGKLFNFKKLNNFF